MIRWEARGREVVAGLVPRVMGIINVTPDSFSDGGRTSRPELAVEQGCLLEAEGADLLDVGGESSRPGSEPVSLVEELRRVLPVVEGLVERARVPISVDTTKSEVARQAVRAGASIINDITALSSDRRLLDVVVESGAGIVLMHMQGVPRTMQHAPHYEDVVGEILRYLEGRIAWAESMGVERFRIAIDPGIGFGKTLEHNLTILRNLERFATLGCALLVGTSRKGMLGTLTGRPVQERVSASVTSSLAAAVAGANVLRVHDVGPLVDAIKVWSAVRGWDEVSYS